MDKTLIYGLFETIRMSTAGRYPKMKKFKIQKIDFFN
jgi:hypothetical protein